VASRGEGEAVEFWELVARESIRDLVARYNANGDSGRFEQMMKVFADDAVMELIGTDGNSRLFEGVEHISTIFRSTKAKWDVELKPSAAGHHVRHLTATHQIDLVDETHARGRCYFMVLMGHGLDHWGRYIDEYAVDGDRWVITHRRAITDGRIDTSWTV
jgi:ketosteroid isomerase-like protein